MSRTVTPEVLLQQNRSEKAVKGGERAAKGSVSHHLGDRKLLRRNPGPALRVCGTEQLAGVHNVWPCELPAVPT